MSRPKQTDQILLALKARLIQFDRDHGLSRGSSPPTFDAIPVLRLIEDLQGIFYHNSKLVAPFYLQAVKQMEDEMTYVMPAKFNKLAMDANVRVNTQEPESKQRLRELAQERSEGIFRCLKCGEVLDMDSTAIIWNKGQEGYEHTTDCTPTPMQD